MPPIEITSEDLKLVSDRAGLFGLLRQKLGWPSVDPEDPFTYEVKLDGRDVKAHVSQIVPFGADDPHPVMLVETVGEFKRGQLREILRGVRADMRNRARFQGKSISDIVFIVASDGYQDMRFCRFVEQDGRQPKLQAFGWTRGEEGATRTLREVNLPALKMPSERPTGGWDWDAKTWHDAWNVEKVQKKFFEGLKAVFEDYLKLIDLVNASGTNQKLIEKGEEVARLMLQTVVNRLLFLAFVQKKGWLKPPLGDGRLNEGRSKEYLFALWDNCTPTAEFEFHERMRQLFFEGLCQPDERVRLNTANLSRIGSVPYLHGSLFEAGKYEQQIGQYADLGWIKLPNGFYEELIGPEGIFRKFNFTISESTPDDVEIAVDPEVLGKVFEKLVTERERHSSGSYYTPREIVQYMCREAIKAFLRAEFSTGFLSLEEAQQAIDKFVDQRDPSQLRDSEAVLKKLRAIKVVDPACGSGAYLVGMMHELVDLRRALFVAGQPDADTDFHRKLEAIENNIYGVDLMPLAVGIARLRFWLSLTVDYGGPTPKPLPNLEYKIEVGDSVSAPPIRRDSQVSSVDELARQLSDRKREFLEIRGDERQDKINEIEVLLDAIASYLRVERKSDAGFLWEVVFAEVFPEGFDVVIGNPPYIRAGSVDNGAELRASRKWLACSADSDLYCYFYERGRNLVASKGVLAFVTSNKWLRTAYGGQLAKFLLSEFTGVRVIDFGELPVFPGTEAYPLIAMCESFTPTLQRLYQEIPFEGFETDYPLRALSSAWFPFEPPSVQLRSTAPKTSEDSIALESLLSCKMRRGLVTGLDDAFLISQTQRLELIAADPRASRFIHPCAVGNTGCFGRYGFQNPTQFLIVIPRGTGSCTPTCLIDHLQAWEDALRVRCDKGDEWFELRSCTYYTEFQSPKIMWPNLCAAARFAYIAEPMYTLAPSNFISLSGNLAGLAILNSAPTWRKLLEVCVQRRGGCIEVKQQYVRTLAFRPELKASLVELDELARAMIGGAVSMNLEERIDSIVGANLL
jgi:hypothetical protein